MRTSRVFALIVAVGALWAGCVTVPNEGFCCSSAESCAAKGAGGITDCEDPERPYCDDRGDYGASNTCIAEPAVLYCSAASECSPQHPVCDVGGTDTCVGCATSEDCAEFGDLPQCEAGSGACVECLESSHCGDTDRPVCGEDFACRGCDSDDECDSGVCDEGTGECVAEDDIAYVSLGGSGVACTREQPCATIGAGVSVLRVHRRFVLIAPGSYREKITLTNKVATLVGSGVDLTLPDLQQGTLVEIAGDSDVAIEGMRIHGATGSLGHGLRCRDYDDAFPRVHLKNVVIRDNSEHGIDASECDLVVEGCDIVSNNGSGIAASNSDVTITGTVIDHSHDSGVSAYRGEIVISASTISGNSAGGISTVMSGVAISNSFIVKNGSTGSSVGGVSVTSPSALFFDFNTVGYNTTSAGFAAAIQCSSTTTRTLSNNIFVGTNDDQIWAMNCRFTYSMSNDDDLDVFGSTGNINSNPAFVDAGEDDYHLSENSPGVNMADPDATLASDFDGDARPTRGRSDIGADETP